MIYSGLIQFAWLDTTPVVLLMNLKMYKQIEANFNSFKQAVARYKIIYIYIYL